MGPLTARHRLHNRGDFLRFFEKSEVFRLSECVVYRIKNTVGHFRLGITLKARGSSVERNKVKRQIREMFRKLGKQLGDYDYNVVIPSTKKIGYPFPQRLQGALLKLEELLSKRSDNVIGKHSSEIK